MTEEEYPTLTQQALRLLRCADRFRMEAGTGNQKHIFEIVEVGRQSWIGKETYRNGKGIWDTRYLAVAPEPQWGIWNGALNGATPFSSPIDAYITWLRVRDREDMEREMRADKERISSHVPTR